MVIKLFLHLLSIIYSCFGFVNKLLHLDSEFLRLEVDVRFSGQQQVNRKQIVFTIKDFKRSFLNAYIYGKIDSNLGDSYIVNPVLLVFIKQMCSKYFTNGVIHVFYLTISLRILSRYCYSMWFKSFPQGFPKVGGESQVSVMYNRFWNAKILYYILKKQQCNLLSCQKILPHEEWDQLSLFCQANHIYKDSIVTL